MIDQRQIQLLEEQKNLLAELVFFEKVHMPVWKSRTATYVEYGKYVHYTPWTTMNVGEVYDIRYDEARWFEADVTVPESMKGKRLVLELLLGGEALVTVNGEPKCGVTFFYELVRGNVLPRTRVDLTDSGVPGTVYHVSIQTNLNYKDFYKGSRYNVYADDNHQRYTMQYAFLGAVDEVSESLVLDLENLLLVAESYKKIVNQTLNGETNFRYTHPEDQRALLQGARDHALYEGVQNAMRAAYDLIPFFSSKEEMRKAVPAAAKALHDALKKLPKYDQGEVTVSGFAHMDIVWLWEERHTVRKVENTFLNALQLIDRYPEYVFTFSQPYTYEMMEKHCPALFEKIVERVKDGHIDPIGNLWVEMDTNIASGESIIRQLLYGRAYQLEKFGRESRVFYMPDSFGYPASLPQILVRSGIEYFYTNKLYTNELYRFPYTFFLWQGIDGTRIRSYLMRVGYNGRVNPTRLAETTLCNENKAFANKGYLTFGYGDGGGGAEYKMLESCRRFKDLPGIPKVRMGKFEDFLDEVYKPVKGTTIEDARKAGLPVWDDELYLDRHRGTFTTMGAIKKLNRRSEFAMRRLEILSSMNALLTGAAYPKAELDALWKELLHLQFHDSLPGSSITHVNRAAVTNFTKLLKNTAKLESRLTKELGAALPKKAVLNTLSRERTVEADDGIRELPPFGWSAAVTPSKSVCRATEKKMENQFFRLTFDKKGRIASLIDKRAKREVFAAPGNAFQWFGEIAKLQLSAWDIHPEYEGRELPFPAPSSVEVVEAEGREASVRFTYEFGGSRLTQDVVLYADIDRIDFKTHVDWHENMKLLKVAFAPAVHAREATYEIQFGAIARPTHRNTTYDAMRYEVMAHKWADISESDYGLSILNDCKYGYDAHGDVIRLTLLRAPMEPDCTADRGEHDFTYSLFPHEGPWTEDTVYAALELNEAPVELAAGKGNLPETGSFFTLFDERMVIDTFKQAEDGNGYILRLYEATGGSGKETVTSYLPIASVTECNLMETETGPVPTDGKTFSFDFKPFEIRSFRVTFEKR